jgi:hypothetical protein
MKTSNLFGILALGGIGYYFLKNKKNKVETQLVSATAPSTTYTPPTNVQSQLVENPYATATKVDNSFYNTPVSTPKVNTINTVNTSPTSTIKPTTTTTPTSTIKPSTSTVTNTPSVKIETALSTLGLQTNCGVPTVGWDFDGDLAKYRMSEDNIRNLILNPELKKSSNIYADECGNIYITEWLNLLRDKSSEAVKDGFHIGVIGAYNSRETPYFMKNKRLYLLPSTLIENYRNKYLAPLASYIKRLPEISLSTAHSKAIFDLYPKDGIWTIPPHAHDGNAYPSGYVLTPSQLKMAMQIPYGNIGLEGGMKINSSQYSTIWLQKLVRNPQSRNYGSMYIDQFGNIIETRLFSDRETKGWFRVPAWELAQYRVDNNIPF